MSDQFTAKEDEEKNLAMNESAGAFVQHVLDGYPDAAVLVDHEANVLATNEKGISLKLLLQHGQGNDINQMIAHAVAEGTVVVSPIILSGKKGEVMLEISVVPMFDGEARTTGQILVLSHDVTMERNLRSALVESRQRYKDLVEVSSDFAWEVNTEGVFSFVSPSGAIGYQPDDLLNRRPEEFVIDPDTYNPFPFSSYRPMEDIEMWLHGPDGENACVMVSCLPLTSEDGEWSGVRGVCRDVTDERRQEVALKDAQEREQLLGYIVNSIREELDPSNMLTNAAMATSQALGASGCRIYRKTDDEEYVNAAEYGNVEGLEKLDELVKEMGKGREDCCLEIGEWQVLASKTGYRKKINGEICIWRPAEGKEWDNNFHILIHDVANQIGIANEQIANHEHILNLSRTDSMTGLLNRRAFFEDELPRRFKRLAFNKMSAALFYVDLDNFKLVNDVHGHQAGDDAIICLRDLLLEYSRPGDAIVRLGGDEFALWMDGMEPEVALTRVEAILKASERLKTFSGSEEKPLGVSIGIVMYDPELGESLEAMIARADGAMYDAKKAGKGGYRVAPPAEAVNS